MRKHASLLFFVGLLIASAGSLEAQQTTSYRGFWIGFGFGGGWSGDEIASGETLRGAAGYLRAGGTVSSHFLFGGEVQWWWRSDDSRTFTRANTSAIALVYPSVDLGLFLKGGVGVTAVQNEQFTKSGLGTTFGTGYDFRLGDNFFLTPNADLLLHFLDDFTESTFVFSLGLTWH